MALQIIGDFVLQVFATLGPFVQEIVKLFNLQKVVVGFTLDRRSIHDVQFQRELHGSGQ